MKRTRFAYLRAGLVAALSLFALAASAQGWPSRPVRVVVPFGPGSSPDVFARILQERLAQRLGQPVVVENRPGAGGALGVGAVAKAAPDGYTIGIGTNGPLVYSTVFNPNLGYDPFRDLVPVILGGGQPNVCAVSPALGVTTVQDWVELMRRHPGRFNYSSIGVGSMSHLTVEILKLKSRSFAVHLPYPSSPAAVAAILQGEVHFTCVPPVAVMPQARAGKLKALAVTTAERSPLVPELPTLRESGYPEIQAIAWMAFVAPAKTPAEIVARLNRELGAILREPETVERMAKAYMEPIGSSPEGLARWMKEELDRWTPVIRYAGLKAE